MSFLNFKQNFLEIMRLILAFVMFSCSMGFAQNAELDRRNGFKDIKLNSQVSAYDGLELKKSVNDKTFPEAELYMPKKGFYETIGGKKIHSLTVKTYKGDIFEIKVIVSKDADLYKGLKKNFGDPKFDLRKDEYYWATEKLRLSYASLSKSKIVMTYWSYPVHQKLKDNKKKEIEAIADDF